jgi:hypothetical protein
MTDFFVDEDDLDEDEQAALEAAIEKLELLDERREQAYQEQVAQLRADVEAGRPIPRPMSQIHCAATEPTPRVARAVVTGPPDANGCEPVELYFDE